jgi:hypothetical protein
LFTSSQRIGSSHPTLYYEPNGQAKGEKISMMRDKCKPEKPAPGRPSDVRQLAASTLGFGLSLVEQIADCVPVPGLRSAIGGLNLILDRFDVRCLLFDEAFVNGGAIYRLPRRTCMILRTSYLPLIG